MTTQASSIDTPFQPVGPTVLLTPGVPVQPHVNRTYSRGDCFRIKNISDAEHRITWGRDMSIGFNPDHFTRARCRLPAGRDLFLPADSPDMWFISDGAFEITFGARALRA